MSSDEITPRTLIQGYLETSSVSKSAVVPKLSLRPRRSSSTAGSVMEGARGGGGSGSGRGRPPSAASGRQSLSGMTPRTLIQGVLQNTKVIQPSPAKRARTTPSEETHSSSTLRTVSRVKTPRTLPSSTARNTRLAMLVTPGGDPTPRSLIRGLIGTASIETPAVHLTTASRDQPLSFPVVEDVLQGHSTSAAPSPFMAEPGSTVDQSRLLRSNKRRNRQPINSEEFQAAVRERLSQKQDGSKEIEDESMPSISEEEDEQDSPRRKLSQPQGSPNHDQDEPSQPGDDPVHSSHFQDYSVHSQDEHSHQVAPSREYDDMISEEDISSHPGDPGQSQDDPGQSQDQPGQSQDQPGQSQDDPGQSQDDPGQSQDQPGQSQDDPGQSQDQPGQSQDDPGQSQDQPGQSRDHPGQSRDHPGQSRDHPGQSRDHPGQSRDHPGQSRDHPGQSRDHPGQSQDQPGQSQDQPGQSQDHPGQSQAEPSFLQNESLEGDKDGTAAMTSEDDSSVDPGVGQDADIECEPESAVSPPSFVNSTSSRQTPLPAFVTRDPTKQQAADSTWMGGATAATTSNQRQASPGDGGAVLSRIPDSTILDSAASDEGDGHVQLETSLDSSVGNAERQETEEGTSGSISGDYSPLVTPRLPDRGSRATPALRKTPAPPQLQTQQQEDSLEKTSGKKRTPVSRQPKDKPSLPTSLTKSILAHFSKARLSKEAVAAAEKGAEVFFKRLTYDLTAYSQHGRRQTIEEADVELLMKRQGLIQDQQSLFALIEKHLPLEYRKELIPMALAGNKVTPKLSH